MTQVKVADGVQVAYGGDVHRPGTELDVDEATANQWQLHGWAAILHEEDSGRIRKSTARKATG